MIEQWPRNQAFVDKEGRINKGRATDLVQQLVNLSILTGEGTPEGNVVAEQTRLYMDTLGTAGNILYIKRDPDIAGDRSQGWILV